MMFCIFIASTMQTASPDFTSWPTVTATETHEARHRAHDELGGVRLLLLRQARVQFGLERRADLHMRLNAEAADDKAFLGGGDVERVGLPCRT